MRLMLLTDLVILPPIIRYMSVKKFGDVRDRYFFVLIVPESPYAFGLSATSLSGRRGD
jgi:hypothetical protein